MLSIKQDGPNKLMRILLEANMNRQKNTQISFIKCIKCIKAQSLFQANAPKLDSLMSLRR